MARIFVCNTCNDGKEMTPAEVQTHLGEVHHVPAPYQGTKSMVSHMDGRDWYASVYTWTFEGCQLTETATNKRAKNDPMRFD